MWHRVNLKRPRLASWRAFPVADPSSLLRCVQVFEISFDKQIINTHTLESKYILKIFIKVLMEDLKERRPRMHQQRCCHVSHRPMQSTRLMTEIHSNLVIHH